MGNFVEEQKAINVQINQKIEAVESSLNKKLDNMHSELQSSITRLSNQQQGPGKGNSLPRHRKTLGEYMR